jgi:histidine phosphotransferase ChpT
MTDPIDLAALIGSRICHDLISPIGAIGNGVELLMLDGAGHGPEMALIAQSVTHANARIRFFRVAYGIASTDQRIARTEVQSILADMTRGGRQVIDWDSANDLSRAEVKLTFLLLQCLETAMITGGRITVVQVDAGWTMTGTAQRLKLDTPGWALLTDPAAKVPDLTPGHVQFALVLPELTRLGRGLTVSLGEGMISFTF